LAGYQFDFFAVLKKKVGANLVPNVVAVHTGIH
jgi:hypothetical protein